MEVIVHFPSFACLALDLQQASSKSCSQTGISDSWYPNTRKMEAKSQLWEADRFLLCARTTATKTFCSQPGACVGETYFIMTNCGVPQWDIQGQLDFELHVVSCPLFLIVLERLFTTSCIAILLPWSQDKGMQGNHSMDFLPNNSFSQSHVPVKSIPCIQEEVKQRLVCLLILFCFVLLSWDVSSNLEEHFGSSFQPPNSVPSHTYCPGSVRNNLIV